MKVARSVWGGGVGNTGYAVRWRPNPPTSQTLLAPRHLLD